LDPEVAEANTKVIDATFGQKKDITVEEFAPI
jgi:hypothetical protein